VTAIDSRAVASLRIATDTDTAFADRLRPVREARGWTAVDLARRLGQHVQFIVTIECPRSNNRKRRRVSVGEAVAICAVLGVDLAAMLDPDRTLASLLGGDQ
jgi:transcriptional regulator with XRE-family HTH domain